MPTTENPATIDRASLNKVRTHELKPGDVLTYGYGGSRLTIVGTRPGTDEEIAADPNRWGWKGADWIVITYRDPRATCDQVVWKRTTHIFRGVEIAEVEEVAEPVELERSDEMPSAATEHEWYACRAETETGTSMRWYRRRGTHAAGAGRHYLAYVRSFQQQAEVTVYETMRTHTSALLATVTDTAEPIPEVADLERAIEAARITQLAAAKARTALIEAAERAYNTEGADLTANEVARRLNGVVSRPTVLKFLEVGEAAADL